MAYTAWGLKPKDTNVVHRANTDAYHNIIIQNRSKMYAANTLVSQTPGVYHDRKVINVLYQSSVRTDIPLITNVTGTGQTTSNLYGSENSLIYFLAQYYANDYNVVWYITYNKLSDIAPTSAASTFNIFEPPVYTNANRVSVITKSDLISEYGDYINVINLVAYSNGNDGQYSSDNPRRMHSVPAGKNLTPTMVLNFNEVVRVSDGAVEPIIGEIYCSLWSIVGRFAETSNTNLTGEFDKTDKIDVTNVQGTTADPMFMRCWWSLPSLIKMLNGLNLKFTFDLNEVLETNSIEFTDGYVESGQGNASPGGGTGTGDNSSDPIELETPGISTYSTFNQLYSMSNVQMNALASYLWSASWLDDFKLLFNQPIEGVISCKLFPFSITGHDSGHVGNTTAIQIGNVTTTAMGQPIQSGYNSKFDLGSIAIDEYFGSFMDYDPYTDVYLYLPYIGIRQMPTNEVMAKTLTITYIVDLMTGACTAVIKTGDIIICSFDGMMGVDIPVTGSNAARFGAGVAASVATGAAGAGALIAGAATGGAALAVAGAGLAISTAKNVISNKRTIEKGNSIDAQNGFHMPNHCYLIITRPEQQLPQNYGSQFGFPSNLGQTLNQVSGYTECYDVKANSITGATADEVAEIKQLLETGVIIR